MTWRMCVCVCVRRGCLNNVYAPKGCSAFPLNYKMALSGSCCDNQPLFLDNLQPEGPCKAVEVTLFTGSSTPCRAQHFFLVFHPHFKGTARESFASGIRLKWIWKAAGFLWNTELRRSFCVFFLSWNISLFFSVFKQLLVQQRII